MATQGATARKHAEARIEVRSSGAEAYDRTPGPALMEVRIRETFSGDIEGEPTVRALQAEGDDKSANMVSLQRFCGTLDGRRGAFVLQGAETVADGAVKGTWSVVPGSGTDELSGLRGEGGFEGRFGEGSRGSLDYWFE
jgi:hypothetical protein